MARRYTELLFTPTVRALQEAHGSREAYAAFDDPETPPRDRLGEAEQAFIAARDSFYMASVSETGWPYMQHRGGPKGFLKVLDDKTLAFADYRGNRQYLSAGNTLKDDRVSLFLMDYVHRRRLKLLGRARFAKASDDPALLARVRDDYGAKIEHVVVITVEAFDWNCPQHITPRFTEEEITAILDAERPRS